MSGVDMGNVADDGATALYRLYDRAGDLLYVGIAFDPMKRVFTEHEDAKPWFGDVATVKINWFSTRYRAAANEAYLIDLLQPRHNITHKGPRVRRCALFPACSRQVRARGHEYCREHRMETVVCDRDGCDREVTHWDGRVCAACRKREERERNARRDLAR